MNAESIVTSSGHRSGHGVTQPHSCAIGCQPALAASTSAVCCAVHKGSWHVAILGGYSWPDRCKTSLHGSKLQLFIVAAFAASLAACVASDDPSLTVLAGPDGVSIKLDRGPDHVFSHVSATVNGVDAGPPRLSEGHQSLRYGTYPATAELTWAHPVSSSLHIVINDDGAEYTLDAPDAGLPRTPTVVTPLNVPLRGGDWVQVTTGITTDRIGKEQDFPGKRRSWMLGNLASKPNDYCFVQADINIGDGSSTFQVPEFKSNRWNCASPFPTAGSSHAVKLEFDLYDTTAITTCAGPALTCNIFIALPKFFADATVEF
jgi:hypothetical protein